MKKSKGDHMIYTQKTKLAMKLAYHAHEGQLDKCGMPYIFHPIHIAEQMGTEDEVIAALLHDVIEDTPISLNKIRQYGFSTQIIDALELLTRDKSADYMNYIHKLKHNKLARKVKMTDLKHNSDLTRLNKVTDRDLRRAVKYKKAMEILESEDTKHDLDNWR